MFKNFISCILTAFLLIISYPQIEWWLLAWVALVPLFFVLEGLTLRKAFGAGFLFGYIFFFGTLGWLIYVTYPGTFLLCAYLALYPALFASGFVWFRKLPLIARVFVLASLWTALEFIRANLFTGFGWVVLGHSQYKNLFLIQIVDTIGLYGISFLVMLVNLVIFQTIKAFWATSMEDTKQLKRLQIITAVVIGSCLIYGAWIFKTAQFSETVKVAVVQPNISQKMKWKPSNMPWIIEKTLNLTDQVAGTNPDLILWPETSLPGILSEQPAYLQRIQLKAMDLNIPIVMGSIMAYQERYYNSAILIGQQGRIQGHYHKIHLVPFGEFLPLRPVLGWINHYIGLEDFSSGNQYTLFPIGRSNYKFGMLICFEDTLNDLPRNFTRAGAQLLMNMTNDAWFMDTKQPFLHLAQAVFESVQNRRSMVRSANTGVSGFIDPLGRIIGLAQDERGKKTFVTATAVCDVPINNHLSFYTKYSEIFTYLCFVCILWGVIKIRRIYGQKNINSR